MDVVVRGERDAVGAVGAGESWSDAARRVSGLSDPVPLDLSSEVKVFAADSTIIATIRAAGRGDLPDLARWRQAEHVHRWWRADGDPTLEAVTAQYADSLDGLTPTRMWIAEVNGRSIGFVQDYRIGDYPDYALLAPDPDAIGIDYAIGDVNWIGRGLGVRVLWAWMNTVRLRFPDVTAYFAAPDHRNAASLRMLAKAGFTQGLWFDEPQTDGSVDTVIGCTLDVRRVLG